VKRLLCILSNMNAGGAETFLMKIYRTIDRSKYQFDFCLCISEKGFYDDEIEALGGRIYHITAKTKSISSFRRELSKIVRDNNYKYVLRITANAIGLLDLRIAKSAGAEVCIARSSNSNDEGGFKSHIAHRIGQALFLRYVDKRIAPSDLAAIYTFGEKYFKKGEVTILHNALDLNHYMFNPEARLRIRNEFDIPENAFVVGHVGRFMTQKNHKKIIEVFQTILLRKPNSFLLLVGNGELEERIRELVAQKRIDRNVVFAGLRKDIPEVLSAMDVFVMPSIYEGMPNTVIEAQATGLPCVISDTITREANITGIVKYVALEDSEDKWASEVLNSARDSRLDTKQEMLSSGYDIDSSAKAFVEMVFSD